MRRLHPPADLTSVLARDARADAPGASSGDGELTDEELLHEYAYPSGHSWLRANMVGSLDGVATLQGLSEGLSGPVDKRVFGLLRVLADVVVAGAGTVRTENYRGARVAERFAALRASLGQHPTPPIALVSSRLGLDPAAAVFTDTSVRPIVLTCSAADRDRRAALTPVAEVIDVGEHEVDLRAARAALEERGLNRILCEGGPSLLHDLITAQAVDELCLTISPQLVGGGNRHVLNGSAFARPAAAHLVGVLEQDGILLTRYLLEH